MSIPFPGAIVRDSGTQSGIEWCTVLDVDLDPAVSGHARIPAGHPWYGKAITDIPVEAPAPLIYDVTAGWIGFSPFGPHDHWTDAPIDDPHPEDRHWSAQMVAAHALDLAQQIADAAEWRPVASAGEEPEWQPTQSVGEEP